MEMVDKMKPANSSITGSRIASVHNGSSLFTGDAGGGESNIRRYIIENDLLEAIIQLPNNLFYNTGITTYIWILGNNKKANRKGKVQLIDAGQLYRKLRKNLGNKNCEFAPEHIEQIIDVYQNLTAVERLGDEGIASKVFDNQDFGYYKVTIERPKRLKTQFSAERIADLRFANNLREPMTWAYETFGENIYTDLPKFEKKIIDWCDAQELNLSRKLQETLVNPLTWKKQQSLLEMAKILMEAIGNEEYNDFNVFKKLVDDELKARKEKLSASEKNLILNAVSWYDVAAEKVIKSTSKFTPEKLNQLLERLGCLENQLSDFGYFITSKKLEFLEYETESDLRDTENVPLKELIYDYFIREVKPHVSEAWLNLDSTKIGYEISFNKYFYRHKPLRDLEEVSSDILALEDESDGLIREILALS